MGEEMWVTIMKMIYSVLFVHLNCALMLSYGSSLLAALASRAWDPTLVLGIVKCGQWS